MSADVEHEQRLEAAALVLGQRVAHFCEGRQLNDVTLNGVLGIIKDHRATSIKEGLRDFPVMVPLCLQSIGWIEIVRADLEPVGIYEKCRNIIARFPKVDPSDLAQAIRRCFPGYNPNHVIQARAARRSN